MVIWVAALVARWQAIAEDGLGCTFGTLGFSTQLKAQHLRGDAGPSVCDLIEVKSSELAQELWVCEVTLMADEASDASLDADDSPTCQGRPTLGLSCRPEAPNWENVRRSE
ncbi:hypothetical protein CLAIMM_09431 [Cladophialophora immunda]|nr:hypothetical protein CLAIMM_09431 [Cladophialophora immunda]